MKQWYETLFENYAKTYDKEGFTQGTIGECDFLEKEVHFDKTTRILDVGCGTGRHAIEMTKRGYSVTGVDLSEDQLKHAKAKAEAQNLDIDFQLADARNLPFQNEFDTAIMICEGGFPLMETDEMNFEILESISKSLKSSGKLILTTLNGLFPIFNSTQEFTEGNDGAQYKENTFDWMTFRDTMTIEIEDDDGNKKTITANERFYIPPEISWLLKSLGFKTIEFFAAQLGEFSRDHQLTRQDFEMLVIAER